MEFLQPWGFYALLALIPLIILYLIKPKPKDMTIPSLMFLMKDSGKHKKATFFQKILKDLLFIIQFLAILALALALTYPVVEVAYDTTAKNTVIVLDVSASMQTKINGKTRFSEAINIAKDSIKGKTSIILAESTPILVLEKASESKAESFLSIIKPKDTGTNLGDAIMLAGDILTDNEGRVIIISDFIQTFGPEPDITKKLLEARGIAVEFVKIGKDASNIGIVDLEIGKTITKVYVKNFFEEERAVTVQAKTKKESIGKKVKVILPNSIGIYEFENQNDAIEIEILDKDDLMADNKAYIAPPPIPEINVLLISNKENRFLKNALESSPSIILETTEPPVFPNFDDFDVIIADGVEPDLMLSGTLDDIMDHIKKGSQFIVTGNNNLLNIDFGGLMAVRAISISNSSTTINKDIINSFTKDVDFGALPEYYITNVDETLITIASANDNSSLMAYKIREKGRIFYYGIIDEKSDFKYSPYYPIFWTELINFLVGAEDINNFNYPTGKILAFDSGTEIKLPGASITTTKLLMDEIGLYEIDGKIYAANLISEKESNINLKTEVKTKKHKDVSLGRIERKKEVNLEIYILLFIFTIIILELVYIKMRGDL